MAVYPTGAIHKPVDNFCYDTGTMSWIMQTCSGSSGGGGGPIQDGVDPLILATVLDLADSNPLTVAIVDAAGDQITSFGSGAIRNVSTKTVNGFVTDTDVDCTNCESVVINFNSTNLDATLIARFSIDGATFVTKDVLEITQNLSMARFADMMLTGAAANRSFLFVIPPGAVTARVSVSAYASGTAAMTVLATSESHQTVAALVRRDTGDVATGVPTLGFSASGVVTIPTVAAFSTYDKFATGFVAHIASAANDAGSSLFTKLTDGTDTALVTAAGEQNVFATAQPGVDIGDVTINNAVGAAAVNIQDGGNSITVDGTVALSAGAATIGKVDQGLTGTNASAWWAQIGDTTNGPVAVKAASTAASAADKSLVVIESPNSKIKTANASLTSGVSASLTLNGLFSLVYLTVDTSTLFSPTGPWGGFLEVVGTASAGPYDVPVWLMPLAAGARDSIQPGLSLVAGSNNLTQAGLLSAAQNRDNRIDTFQGVSIYAIDVSGLASLDVTASSTYGFTGTATVVLQAFAVSTMQTRPTPPGANHIGETTGAAVGYLGDACEPGKTQALSMTASKRLRVDTELNQTEMLMPLVLAELKAIHMQLAHMSGAYVNTVDFVDSISIN